MKSTGIVRRIDELGRVVIPKELRRTLRLREGEELEVFAGEEGSLILKKFSAVREMLPFAGDYAAAVYESTGFTTVIADTEIVAAAAGDIKLLREREELPRLTRSLLEGRKTVKLEGVDVQNWIRKEFSGSAVIAPILKNGDLHGAAILFSTNAASETQVRIAETAARFFARAI